MTALLGLVLQRAWLDDLRLVLGRLAIFAELDALVDDTVTGPQDSTTLPYVSVLRDFGPHSRLFRQAMTGFCRFELRTTDADAARRFYTRILGHDRAVVWPLHEQARARGAPPHWLGYLGVKDVEASAAAFVARGAIQLGPAPPTSVGGQAVVLRDPGGAVLALSTPPLPDTKASVEVAWHVLNSSDSARAAANYHELFGWELTERIERGATGTFQQFAWHAGSASVGAIADIEGRSGVHAHWLFFFAVDALEPVIDEVRAAGGLALAAMTLPGGERICVCDDPQGAAFALCERRA